MIHRLRYAVGAPIRILAIKVLMQAAWWLARPSIAKVPILEHYDLICEFETSQLSNGAAYCVDRGTLLVNCHQVLQVKSKTAQAVDDAEETMNKELHS